MSPRSRASGRLIAYARTGITLASMVASRAAAQAPSSPRHGLTVEEALATALRRNADVLIARAASDSAHAEVRIARALPNPIFAGSPNTPYQYSAALTLDVGPQRTFRTRAAMLGADASRFDVRDAQRQLAQAVRVAFLDVLLADARRRLLDERREVTRQLLVADSSRLRAGDVPERNVTRSEAELARVDADLARAGLDARGARLSLQLLMGESRPDTGLAISGSLVYRPIHPSLDSLRALAVARRPDLAASNERVAQTGALRRLASASLFPVPQLSYVRQLTGPFESGHYYSFGLSFELPILSQYDGLRARASASADAADLVHQRVTRQAERDVATAYDALETQRSLVERYEGGLVAKLAQSVTSARYAYERGATSLLDVLDALRAHQEVRADHVGALHDYWVAIVALDAAAGGGALDMSSLSADRR